MIRAIIENGEVRLLDPLPADWCDGRELIVEEAEQASAGDLEEWYRELQLLGHAQYEPGEWEGGAVAAQRNGEIELLVSLGR
jgi:hypothetical protein